MIPIERAEHITELDYKQIRMIDRLFGGEANVETGLTLTNFIIILTYDFFRRSGMTIERFSAAFTPFIDQFRQTADYISLVIKQGSKLSVIPKVFISVVDNRYMTVVMPGLTSPRLWDSVDERWVDHTEGAPVFTLTLSLPALYFKVAAPHLGQTELADMFKHARTGREDAHV